MHSTGLSSADVHVVQDRLESVPSPVHAPVHEAGEVSAAETAEGSARVQRSLSGWLVKDRT